MQNPTETKEDAPALCIETAPTEAPPIERATQNEPQSDCESDSDYVASSEESDDHYYSEDENGLDKHRASTQLSRHALSVNIEWWSTASP